MIWPFRTPIEHDGRLYIYYGALAGLHGDVYQTVPDMRMFRGGAALPGKLGPWSILWRGQL